MKILLAGGGTAGHINPALSIANFIKSRKPECEIRFVGSKEGLETTLVPKAGYQLSTIEVYGFKRSLSLYNIKAIGHLLSSVREAGRIIDAFQPDVVIGTGGYVSGPVLYAASRRKLPTAIHEQNAFPGVTTRILSRMVDRVMISFESSRVHFKDQKKPVLVGNPIREEMLFCAKEEARAKLALPQGPLVASFAGSLGAREFNKSSVDVIARNVRDRKFCHIHATGKYGWRWVPGLLAEKGVSLEGQDAIRVSEYIYNMPDVMAAADLLVCRSGAITLGEIAVMGKPAILIPSPNVTNNHQYHNAMAFVNAGAAVLLEEKEATGDRIYTQICELLGDPAKLREMAENAHKLAIFDSTQKIYDLINELIRKKE